MDIALSECIEQRLVLVDFATKLESDIAFVVRLCVLLWFLVAVLVVYGMYVFRKIKE